MHTACLHGMATSLLYYSYSYSCSKNLCSRELSNPFLIHQSINERIKDCCTPMLFQGEEIDVAVRAWTHGYDMYTPHNSVAFHPYHRKSKPPMFWENSNQHKVRLLACLPTSLLLCLVLSGVRK